MTDPSPLNPAGAGLTLVGAMLLFAALGLGVGEIVGAPVLVGLVGLFAGAVVGVALVRARFRDL
ncbi:hypothetical protein JDY09_02260 [Thermoleophilum album]|jgi:hypothetical protein|uniref:hypothetical protein n=1 Tax=Thermoleophilum album TaxID=29539 RepID=UPI00237CAE7A|nr:hypothetical protein [Thermoleophilum album]WDT94099.1 hypothetical protein JDY09_02260 [Thermoleophilum album]